MVLSDFEIDEGKRESIKESSWVFPVGFNVFR
jgi:hypothetical protein